MTMRLIDAEDFQRDIARMCVKRCHLYENDDDFPNCRECVANFIYEMLRKAPTIEAKPVVHAHWEEDSDFDFEEEIDLWFHYCSKCEIPLYGDIEEFKYCPYCGAQMDEFAGDNNVGSKTENDKKIREEVERIRREREEEGRKYD